ncbi:MAG: hypothetical protein HUJ74_03910 [Lachnospiraceae bacterium]|nr:hypothetical protein [Lachnospiraceae bacterium]
MWGEPVVIKEATCQTEGKKVWKCTACEETKVEEIPLAQHMEVVDPAAAATCTAAGKTEGKHCSVCNTVLVAQNEVKALGHKEVKDAAGCIVLINQRTACPFCLSYK